MATAKESAIKEAQLDAAIAEVMDGFASGETVIAAMQTDEANTTTFVTDRRNVDTVDVFNRFDGTKSEVLVSMLSKQLRKRFPRDPGIPQRFWGQRAFSIEPPADVIAKPQLKCWLHAEHEKRDGLNAIGLSARFCTKSNIPSEMDVRMHVQRKHPQEYRIINESIERISRDEDRALQRQQVEAMMKLAANAAGIEQTALAPEKE